MTKSFLKTYFDRYAWQQPLMPTFDPPLDMEMVVFIPALREKNLLKAMLSIDSCPVNKKIVILILINESENADQKTISINNEIEEIIRTKTTSINSKICICRIKINAKKAGVGLARKIGMDEAARWFKKINKNGIIICFDADCTCDNNFLMAIYNYYKQDYEAGIVNYAHPLDKNGIIPYELHLRYLVDAQKFANYPFAFQTLGSCISIRSESYCKYGGMNTRKAGEDFYFLHHIASNIKIGEITTTTIYPSSRCSDRVPFGTGRAINNYSSSIKPTTYHPEIFKHLKLFISILKNESTLKINYSQPILYFIKNQNYYDALHSINKNTTNKASRIKAKFQWFNGFRVMKFMNLLKNIFFENIPIEKASEWLNKEYWQINNFEQMSITERLLEVRKQNQYSDYQIGLNQIKQIF